MIAYCMCFAISLEGCMDLQTNGTSDQLENLLYDGV